MLHADVALSHGIDIYVCDSQDVVKTTQLLKPNEKFTLSDPLVLDEKVLKLQESVGRQICGKRMSKFIYDYFGAFPVGEIEVLDFFVLDSAFARHEVYEDLSGDISVNLLRISFGFYHLTFFIIMIFAEDDLA